MGESESEDGGPKEREYGLECIKGLFAGAFVASVAVTVTVLSILLVALILLLVDPINDVLMAFP